MTDNELISGVQAHFNDFSPEFKTRINDTIPFGVAQFAAHTQWEFLDKYVEGLTVQDSTDKAVGKPQIVTPGDFFKPVIIFTDSGEIEYVSRRSWASQQGSTIGSTALRQSYTVIGDELILSRPDSGAQINMTYTRDKSTISFSDVFAQYHPAVQAGIQLQLSSADRMGVAHEIYREAVMRAMTMEVSGKGRTKKLVPSPIVQREVAYHG